jgi:methionine sulfoxide reductase heme-binding subunit
MSQLAWFVARSSGIVAWVLVSASIVWGLLMSGKPLSPKKIAWARPNRMLDLHRFLGALAVVFTVIHVGAIIADSYVQFDLIDVLVPFASSWRPAAVAWGVVGGWLLLAVQVTSMLRRHLSKKVWRAVHMTSYPLFVFSTVHAITAGTDASNPLFTGAVAAASIGIVALTLHRVREHTRPSATARSSEPRQRVMKA